MRLPTAIAPLPGTAAGSRRRKPVLTRHRKSDPYMYMGSSPRTQPISPCDPPVLRRSPNRTMPVRQGAQEALIAVGLWALRGRPITTFAL
jgi:hypothetical protein